MKTLFTVVLGFVLSLGGFAQSGDVSFVNGRYVNSDGSNFNGTYTQYENNIKVAVLDVSNGLLDGAAMYYHNNGQLRMEGSYREGVRSGTWKTYSNMGDLLSMSSFSQGLKDGKWEVWDQNGNKRFEMYYSKGKKVGTWKMWDEDGKLSTKEFGQ